MYLYKYAKERTPQEDAVRDAVTGAAAGTTAAFATNAISQISNMKASHPERHGNQKWYEVVKALWNKPNYKENTQRLLDSKIRSLSTTRDHLSGVTPNDDIIKGLDLKIKTLTEELAASKPAGKMKLKAFYSGFGSKALNNALFSAAMFGTLGAYKNMYDKQRNKRINLSVETNG